METEHNPELTGPEITSLWTHYQSESLNLRINSYLLKHIEEVNSELKELFQGATSQANKNLQEIKAIFERIGYPIPQGFTEQDVHLDTQKLFTDNFSLKFLHEMSIHGLSAYSIALTVSTRQDMRQFYQDKINFGIQLFNQTIELLLAKGLYNRPPSLPIPVGIDFIKTANFFDGFFQDKRALNGSEISNIFFNLEKSIVTKALLIGFHQVVKSSEAKKILANGIKVKEKHIDTFSHILTTDNLPAPPILDAEVTSSTIPPFSDKLMMYMTGFLFNTAIAYYGAGMGTTMRSDLIVKYEQFILEDLKFVENWTDFMIKNQWLEQPPKAMDRKNLAEEKPR
ncbi:DUF3231 family protein [Caldibacillus lycopersici]|uniref:DUF3231 family protein n=1 Tax=Perspicuibacillus lycopersici TaxID=1325689 RepID=A0AAE3IQ96_9BACI|nr:DUF3231 family protein [Perspicuibacillus lycopersici]MCU9612578.1 DUF3231 family protein [Perspicuibacillus lycopersici]